MKIHHSHTPLPDKLESSPTVGDIFRKHGEKYREEHGLHPRQHKVMYDIEHCRCGEFGTHWEICDACGHMEKGYNTPAGTAIALDAIILPGEIGWTPGSRIYCPYPITIVFLPYHMSSIHYAALTDGSCMTYCLNVLPKRCWILDATLIDLEQLLAFTAAFTPGAARCGFIHMYTILQPQEA